jgi:Flp pilus assembly protein TadD
MAYVGPYAIKYPIQPGAAEVKDWLPGAIAVLVGVALVLSGIFSRSRRTAVAFGLGWWLAFLAPVSHLVVPIQNYAADRYLFMPSFGLLLAGSALLMKFPRKVALSLTAVAIVMGCGWTIVQTPVWSSSDALFANAVGLHPGNTDAWDKLASSAAERQEPELAWSHTREGLKHSPGHWRLLHRQALLLAADGRLDDAIEMMERATTVPESHKAYANLALLYLRRGDRDDALRMAEEAVRLQAETAHNQRVLGIVTYEMGDAVTACRAFKRAAALDPYDEDNQRNLELCAKPGTER